MKKILFFCIVTLLSLSAVAQSQYQPYSFHFYQKLSKDIYNTESRFHSSLKPYFIDDSLIRDRVKLLHNLNVDTSKKSWVSRKLFNEHLINVEKPDYTFYADFLPDFQTGSDGTWLNTRGYQIGGTVGKKFSFYTSGFENQGQFADYYNNYVENTSKGVVPGQAYNKTYGTNAGKTSLDWAYVTALISYTPVKYLNISAGYDKTFIGDGYRSMLLSDFSSPSPLLRLTGKLGNVQYMAMWTSMQDPRAVKLSNDVSHRKKGGVFHYLDWNVNDRLSFGFFDAIIWGQTDDAGNKRGFDLGYANPIIFLRPIEASSNSPDNALIGLTTKYEFSKGLVGYAQFALDEFEGKNFLTSNGSARNKFGWQLGFRGADLFGIENLNYLVEYNTAKPYTYSSFKPINNYANYNEPLAHPYAANFREVVSIFNYSLKRFDFTAQVLYAKQGLDVGNEHNGKDIFKSYLPVNATIGNYTTQGLRTDLNYTEFKAAYLINPKYNLRLEIGTIFRSESNELYSNNTSIISFGLRSSFRNLYTDF